LRLEMLDENQIYVVVDIETDGPAPGLYSMLSIGAVASATNDEVASFYRKVLPYEEAGQDADTMEWWRSQPEAWKEVTTDALPPEIVMNEFCGWINDLKAKPIFVAHPVGFDYTFVSWYLQKFAQNPFNDYSGVARILDLPSFAAGKLKVPLSKSARPQLPESLKVGMPEHSHKAIDDARGYGTILRNLLKV
jgi:DNA polymerase III alpha subunit (gram-positive type)